MRPVLDTVTSLRRAGQWPALVLNGDFRPLTAFPLSVWPWQTAVQAMMSDRVDVVAEHDKVVRSPSVELRLPSVVALRQYIPVRRKPAFTRYNVLLRDKHCCIYCGKVFPGNELTFDHVIPKSRGGKTCWENIGSACLNCNGTKANRTPEEAKMPLQWRPWRPTAEELAATGLRFRPEQLHNGWRDHLPWIDEMEAA